MASKGRGTLMEGNVDRRPRDIRLTNGQTPSLTGNKVAVRDDEWDDLPPALEARSETIEVRRTCRRCGKEGHLSGQCPSTAPPGMATSSLNGNRFISPKAAPTYTTGSHLAYNNFQKPASHPGPGGDPGPTSSPGPARYPAAPGSDLGSASRPGQSGSIGQQGIPETGVDRGASGTVAASTDRFARSQGSSDSFARSQGSSDSFARSQGSSDGFARSQGSEPRSCHSCGQQGQISRQCPSRTSTAAPAGGRTCHKCGETGHLARECSQSTTTAAGFGPHSGGGFSSNPLPSTDQVKPPSATGGVNGFSSGGGASSGFTSSGFGDTSTTGGFGSRVSSRPMSSSGGGGGSRACHKCGEDGHFARECPQAGGSGGSRACHKCGEDGHFARECPQAGGSGSSRACHKCGEDGHFARECPQAGGGGGSRACHKCGEDGHFARECHRGGEGGGSRACHKCGEDGHFARECPQAGGGGGSRACHKCGEDGHFARECPQAGEGGGSRACHKCGEDGHLARECPQAGGGGGSRACHKCGEDGHFARECPQAGGGGGGSGCHSCGEEGHFFRECPNKPPRDASDMTCHSCHEPGHISRDCPSKPMRTGPPPENYVPEDIGVNEGDLFSSIDAGINFDKYDKIPVEISGNNPTNPISSFSEAGLLDQVMANIRRTKYTKPTPIQKYAIPAILAGRDLMGCAQTGSGKTAAFLLPVLASLISRGLQSSQFSPTQEPQALIVAPTRELVIQIYEQCYKFSLGTIVRCVRLYGGTSTMHQSNDLSKGAHIVVATPGRLMDFLERRKLSLSKLQYLILDEADRMLDMGFEPTIRRLIEQNGMPDKMQRQTLMFSATFPTEIQGLARDFLNDYLFLIVGVVGGANTDVTQSVVEVGHSGKKEKLVEIIREQGGLRTLVFVEQKRSADFLASSLSQSDFVTTSIHGDRLQREREQVLADFKLGRCPILVATSVAARGLDIPGVDHVINFDMPSNIDDYVHRIGRTGRCGNPGRSTSFIDLDRDRDVIRPLVRILSEAQQVVPEFLERAARGGYGSRNPHHGADRFGGHRDTRTAADAGGWNEIPTGPIAALQLNDAEWD